MPRAPPAGMVVLSAIALFIWYVVYTSGHHRDVSALSHADRFKFGQRPAPPPSPQAPIPTLQVAHGDNIMGKLGNETLREELGRAAWKVLHTTMARFPDKPTVDESEALNQYMFLFARLYPCGECAQHFQKLLKKYPPQTSSRSNAAAWACFVHNQVNERKGKPIFDCANIGDFYDCGCADDEKEAIAAAGAKSDQVAKGEVSKPDPIEIETEGPTRGG